MNNKIISALCLSLLCLLPSCWKKSKETPKRTEISIDANFTEIEIDDQDTNQQIVISNEITKF